MSVRKKVAIRVTILAIAGAMAVAVAVQKTIPSSPTVGLAATTSAAPTTKSTEPPAPSSLTSGIAKLEEELRKGGWKRAEVDAIVSLSGDWFDILYGEARDQFEDQVKALARLGKYPEALKLVRMNPEFAGLLALADQPDDLAMILNTDSEKLQTLTGLFTRCTDRHDLNDLVIALKENRDVVVKLLDKGLLGAEVLFVFDRGAPGAKEYDLWLRETMEQKLLRADSDLASHVQLALLLGDDLRRQMKEQETFRKAFPTEMWPKLMRVLEASELPLEYFVGDPNLWKMLAHPRGEELLKRRGLLASELLFGEDHYAEEHHEKVIEVLLGGDDKTYTALTQSEFRKEPQFLDLLKRSLAGPVLAKALTNLMAKGKNYQSLLGKYSRLNDTVLAKEVGEAREGLVTYIPFYTAYELGEKVLDGRGTSGIEIAGAAAFTALDVTSVVFPLAKAGQFLKQSTKTVGKELAKESATAEVRDLAKKAALRNLTKHGAEKLLVSGTEEQMVRWAVTGTLTTMIQNFKVFRVLAGKSTTIDVTVPLKFFYNHTPFGKKTLTRLAKLNAKVLMNADGKVHLEVEKLACHLALKYLNGVREKIKLKIKFDTLERNKHLSAWWLSNLGGGMPTIEENPR